MARSTPEPPIVVSSPSQWNSSDVSPLSHLAMHPLNRSAVPPVNRSTIPPQTHSTILPLFHSTIPPPSHSTVSPAKQDAASAHYQLVMCITAEHKVPVLPSRHS